MNGVSMINENIYRLTLPYKDIFTTVYAVKTEDGVLLFDMASYDEDIEGCVFPFLKEIGVSEDMISCVFISHNHHDHAGGLHEFARRFPRVQIISRCPKLREQYPDTVSVPEDDTPILGVLRAITVPGHTLDSCAVYDTRTKTLISGDCLQLYGIYGSGAWGSNISLPAEHIEAVRKLQKMDIEHILTAHDYHPYGYSYLGRDAVEKALEACISPLKDIKKLILENPEADDGQICALCNSRELPTLGVHVVTAVRRIEL